MRCQKYHNTKTEIDGIRFDSKKEGRRYTELRIMQEAGEISGLRLQVPFELIPNQYGKDGKVAERKVKYIADFVYQRDGDIVVEDVKSKASRTDVYRLKKKLMRHVWGIEVQEV